jgi:hypothetical protein
MQYGTLQTSKFNIRSADAVRLGLWMEPMEAGYTVSVIAPFTWDDIISSQ